MARLSDWKLFLLVLLSFFILTPSYGKIFYSKNEAMELAFGADAKVEMQSLFPDKQQKAKIEKLARVKMESSLFTFYVGKKGDQILGYAAIETHTVRTKPETLLVVLSAEGQLKKIATLAFHEPPEYQPPERWFAQMYNKVISQLSFKTDIQGITGATLSTRAGLESARKVLAIFQVMIKEK